MNSDGKARVAWRMKPEFVLNQVQDHENEGMYVSRTNLAQESPEDFRKGYTRVEATFRGLKQELRLRPVFHQKGGRVEAHILLSYIAYVLLQCIELATTTLRAGDGRRIILERISSSPHNS